MSYINFDPSKPTGGPPKKPWFQPVKDICKSIYDGTVGKLVDYVKDRWYAKTDNKFFLKSKEKKKKILPIKKHKA